MRRQIQDVGAQEEGMNHNENLVQEAPSILYYLGKYVLVSSVRYKTSNGSHSFCMEIPSFTSIK
jgi:hypothetical protein